MTADDRVTMTAAEPMHEILVSTAVLEQLRKLMDWQLSAKGIDPISVTMACIKLDESRDKTKLESLLARLDAILDDDE